MPVHYSVSTPQFRTALIRKLANIAPGYTPRFEAMPRGLAFRMFNARGQLCSRSISIYRNDGAVLQRARLLALLKGSGFPKPQ